MSQRRTLSRSLALLATVVERERPTMVLVTHSRAEAERLADRILVLEGRPARLV